LQSFFTVSTEFLGGREGLQPQAQPQAASCKQASTEESEFLGNAANIVAVATATVTLAGFLTVNYVR
jgi:hypothetical protein